MDLVLATLIGFVLYIAYGILGIVFLGMYVPQDLQIPAAFVVLLAPPFLVLFLLDFIPKKVEEARDREYLKSLSPENLEAELERRDRMAGLDFGGGGGGGAGASYGAKKDASGPARRSKTLL